MTIFRQQFTPEVGTHVDGYFKNEDKQHIIQINGPQHFHRVKGRLIQQPGDRLIDAILTTLGFKVDRVRIGI